MYCIHITNDRREIYLTEEDLSSVFNRKKQKLITWIKTSKVTRGNWEGADETIQKLSSFQSGTFNLKNDFIEIQICKTEDTFYILKKNQAYLSIRYYCMEKDDVYQTLRKEYL